MRFQGQNAVTQTDTANTLLSVLNAKDWALLKPRLDQESAASGTVLQTAGDASRHAFFPCGASLVSCVIELDRHGIETALIGSEGAVGGIISQGSLPSFSRAEVRLGGNFLRIDLSDLEEAKEQSITLRHLFARYAECLLAQVIQTIACNATHSIEQRTAKLLIGATERSGTPDVPLTQAQLAMVLGVGRSYLSRVISAFREQGMLISRRGRTHIRDFDGLRGLACECNGEINHYFDAVLQGVYRAD